MCLAAVLGLVMLVGCQQPKAEPEPGQEAAMATPEPVPAEPPPPLAKQTHVVAKGDTLFSLARQYYNDQGKWKVILEANKEKIPNKDKLKIGTELIIP
jgi:5'-nucleotidase